MAAPTARQTAVADAAVAHPGLIADIRNAEFDSRYSEESSASIPFGVMVVNGTTDAVDGALLPHTSAAASEQILAGIVVHGHDYAIDTEIGADGLKPGTPFRVLRKGRVWVTVEDEVDSLADDVRVRVVTAGNEQAGAFRVAADSTDCVDISAFARWRSLAGAGELALLEIDMVGQAAAAADA